MRVIPSLVHGLVFAATAAAMVQIPACATASPAAPRPGTATLWGYARLVPRPGVEPDRNADGPYADPRFRHAARVEYGRIEFAVAYVEGRAATVAGDVAIAIQESKFGSRLTPAIAAASCGGRVVIDNAAGSTRTVSCPRAGLLRALAPGERLAIEATEPGELAIHVLDDRGEGATVFVAPGPFSVVSGDGRLEIRDIEPGPVRLRAWHPRFPCEEKDLELRVNESRRADIEIGVGQIEDGEERKGR